MRSLRAKHVASRQTLSLPNTDKQDRIIFVRPTYARRVTNKRMLRFTLGVSLLFHQLDSYTRCSGQVPGLGKIVHKLLLEQLRPSIGKWHNWPFISKRLNWIVNPLIALNVGKHRSVSMFWDLEGEFLLSLKNGFNAYSPQGSSSCLNWPTANGGSNYPAHFWQLGSTLRSNSVFKVNALTFYKEIKLLYSRYKGKFWYFLTFCFRHLVNNKRNFFFQNLHYEIEKVRKLQIALLKSSHFAEVTILQ